MTASSLRERLNLSRLALRHPVATCVAWALLALAGVVAWTQLRVALFPDISFPVIVVQYEWSGVTAERLERDVTVPVERALLALAPKSLRAGSGDGAGYVAAEFEVGVSLDEAEGQVRAALRDVAVPTGAALTVRRVDLNESPVVTYALVSPYRTAPQLMGTALGTFLPALRALPGVERVVPLGMDPQAIAALSGQPVDDSLPHTEVRLDGRRAVALEVVKRAGANALEVARAADSVVERLQTDAVDVKLVPALAQATFIRENADATLEALWVAVLLSVLVIHPFLRRWRATVISALAIPASLLGTFVVMRVAGFNLETITLLALALVIGIIVDDAIVDVENIARHIDRGEPPHEAAVHATDEIGLTVTAATLTIVAVFVPVAFMGDVVGRFFKPFGLTISAAVLISLLVARTLSPVLAAWWLRPHHGEERPRRRWDAFAARYRALLGWALAHPWAVVGLAVASLVAGLGLIPLIPKGFIPQFDRGMFEVHLATPTGSSVERTAAFARRVGTVAHADPDVAAVFSVAGTAAGETARGVLHVRLRPDRRSATEQVKGRLRRALRDVPGGTVSVQDVPLIAVIAQKPLQVDLVGDDLAALQAAAAEVHDRIATWPGVADVGVAGGGGVAGAGLRLRLGGRPAASISGNLADGAPIGAIGDRVTSEIPALLPAGVTLALAGESEQAGQVFGRFAAALGMALVGVLVVLLFLFRSWQDPLAIALALPLSAVGAMLGLFVARSDFGMVSLLGLVFLMGLVNKNAILLVDRINQERAEGRARDEAILEAAPVRLRPILMTTAATILGMLPIALGLGAGSELRAPMAVAVIGGLVTSTLLSLLVVPVVYVLLDAPYRSSYTHEGARPGPRPLVPSERRPSLTLPR
ncbi:MAG: efflux RND transporter permease subunit [Gemmatimonadales bacterium]|nr:efflux RND transporter permease subunit [Gemmatimonadales bacterium]